MGVVDRGRVSVDEKMSQYYPTNFSSTNGAGMGCCDHPGLADSGLSGCPNSNPVVVVEQTPIPTWLLIIAGVWAALMLVKKR